MPPTMLTTCLLLLLPALLNSQEQGPNFRLQLVSQAEDGAYDFAYDSGGDNYHIQSRDTSGTVVGKYAYRDPEGKLHEIGYKADQQGFQPEGDVLPRGDLGAEANVRSVQPPPSPGGDSDVDPANQFLQPGLAGLAGPPLPHPSMPRLRKPVPLNQRARKQGARVRTSIRKRVGSPQPVAPLLSTGNFPDPSSLSPLPLSAQESFPALSSYPQLQLPAESQPNSPSLSPYSQPQQAEGSFPGLPGITSYTSNAVAVGNTQPESSSYSQPLMQPVSPLSPPAPISNQQAQTQSQTPVMPLLYSQPFQNTVTLFRSLASMVGSPSGAPAVGSSSTPLVYSSPSFSFGPIPGDLMFSQGQSLQPFAQPLPYPLPQYPLVSVHSEARLLSGTSPSNVPHQTSYSVEPNESLASNRPELVRALIRLVLEFVASDPVLRAQLRDAIHESENNNGIGSSPCQGANCQPPLNPARNPSEQCNPNGPCPPPQSSSPDLFPPGPPNGQYPPSLPPSPQGFPPSHTLSQYSLPPAQSTSADAIPACPPNSQCQPMEPLSQDSFPPPSQSPSQGLYPPCPPNGPCPSMQPSAQRPFLPQSTPQGPFPQQSPSQGPFPPQFPPQGSFPPPQSPPQDSFPPQSPPLGSFPPQSPPQGPFPQQSQPQGPFPPQSFAQDSFSQQSPMQDLFPPQSPPQGSFPPQSPPQDSFPPQSQLQGSFPLQPPPQGSFSPQSPPQGSFPSQSEDPSQEQLSPCPPNGPCPLSQESFPSAEFLSQYAFPPPQSSSQDMQTFTSECPPNSPCPPMQPPSQSPFPQCPTNGPCPEMQASSQFPFPPCQPGGPCPPQESASPDSSFPSPSSQSDKSFDLDSFFSSDSDFPSSSSALPARPDPESPLFTPVEGVRDMDGTKVLERDYLPLTRRYGYFLTQEKSDQ